MGGGTEQRETGRKLQSGILERLPARTKAGKILRRMRANSKDDWQIGDLETVAKELGLRFSPPTRGSHYKVSSHHLPGILVIPARKPIKPPYVKQFVALCKAHCARQAEEGNND